MGLVGDGSVIFLSPKTPSSSSLIDDKPVRGKQSDCGTEDNEEENLIEALSDKPEPACEGCKSEAFRPPTDATRPLRQNGSV